MTQPKTASKFTPGALRAAREILSRQVKDLRLQGIPFVNIQFDRVALEMACVIDRETGLTELLEAAKNILRWGYPPAGAARRLKEAISKSEKGE